MKMRLYLCTLSLMAGAVVLGCSSISSTMIQRSEDNAGWQRGPRTTGVPITLKVPSHVRVEVREKHLLQKYGKAGSQKIGAVALDVPLRSVYTSIIKTEKIFTVDPKRPGAGTAKSTVDFQDQYLDKIDYDVTDNTIKDINSALESLTAPGGILAPTNTSEDTDATAGFAQDPNLMEMNSVVAAELFDLADPALEDNIRSFLDKHLNGCHVCNIVAPGVLPRKPLR